MTDSLWVKITGVDFPVRDYKSSKFVLISSLLFLIPAVAFASNGDYLTSMCITLSCFFSVLGDSVYPNISSYNIYDRLAAILLTGILIARRFSIDKEPDVMFLIKLILPLSIFKYSSMSKTQEEWEIRHSLWHIIITLVFLSEV